MSLIVCGALASCGGSSKAAEDDAHSHPGTLGGCQGDVRTADDGYKECWEVSAPNPDEIRSEFIVSVSKPGFGSPSQAEIDTGEAFQQKVARAVDKYRDFSVAAAAGYNWGIYGARMYYLAAQPLQEQLDGLATKPFLDHLSSRVCFDDGKYLDPDCPEVLMYLTDGGKARLVGVMFMMPPGMHGEQIAGRFSVWHYHYNEHLCYGPNGYPEAMEKPDAADPTKYVGCDYGQRLTTGPEMIHVWLPEVGQDVFSANMNPSDFAVNLTDVAQPPKPYLLTAYDVFLNLKANLDDAGVWHFSF